MRWELQEPQFRRWELVLKEVVDRFPLSTTFRAQGIKPLTAISRFRDALLSLERYQWPTVVDTEKLRQIRPLMKVDLTETGFIVYSKINPASAPFGTKGVIKEQNTEYLRLDFMNVRQPEEVFHALRTLKVRELVREIHIVNLHPEQYDLFKQISAGFLSGVNPDTRTYSIV